MRSVRLTQRRTSEHTYFLAVVASEMQLAHFEPSLPVLISCKRKLAPTSHREPVFGGGVSLIAIWQEFIASDFTY